MDQKVLRERERNIVSKVLFLLINRETVVNNWKLERGLSLSTKTW